MSSNTADASQCNSHLSIKLSALRIQQSIFQLAAPVAGLHLKPAKCVLIVSCVDLTQDLIDAIRSWLINHVPAFQGIKNCDHGKYLGWFLGRRDVSLSFAAALLKLQENIYT